MHIQFGTVFFVIKVTHWNKSNSKGSIWHMKNLRINFVRSVIELNERVLFNRKLYRYYKSELGSEINTIIDVGVNLGQTIDLFLKLNRNCTFYGFEPNPDLYATLEKKYQNKSNINLYPYGISERAGTKTFHENVLHSTSSFEEVNLKSSYVSKKANILGVSKQGLIKKSYPVEIITLCDFINSTCTEKIDVLKIDTEGHEYYCLLGLFAKELKFPVEYIQLENHEDDMYLNKKSSSEIQELLKSNGYSEVKKINHGFGNIQEMIYRRK